MSGVPEGAGGACLRFVCIGRVSSTPHRHHGVAQTGPPMSMDHAGARKLPEWFGVCWSLDGHMVRSALAGWHSMRGLA